MKLSILILTIPSRSHLLSALVDNLKRQAHGLPVEILIHQGKQTIGFKRQSLLDRAVGEYVSFIDDDDLPSGDYVKKILKAVESSPDCVGISGVINGRQWHISREYDSWFSKDKVYYRCPNHLSPVRREIALQVGFPDKNFGEDYDYSMGLRGLLHTEVKIEGIIYNYRYKKKK